ncbi:MAG: hypothetical protein JST86_13090 [Bacteroidetes bacterium]|nr:hypothetical protein [Bacteroidota bacterium]
MTYKIKLVSQAHAMLLVIVLLVVFLVSAGTLLPSGGLQNTWLAILLVSIVAIISYFLWQIFVTGRTLWTIDDNEIKIVWTKKFYLNDGKDVIIKWSEIKDISRGLDPQYYNLKIKLQSGDTIKYFHDTLTTRDDFEEMLKVLYQTLHDKKNTAKHCQ